VVGGLPHLKLVRASDAFEGMKTEELQYHIVHHEPKALPDEYSLEIRNLIRLI
jgi:hypothetical protein